MIYSYPVGGLGNIFFQLATLWSLAKDNNDTLCLLNLDKLYNDAFTHSTNPIPHAKKWRYVLNRFPNKNITAPVYRHSFTYSPLPYKKDYEYISYFQCEKYFKHRKNDIIKLLEPADEFNADINKYSNLFGNISMHIRRGNYVGSKVFDIIPKDYYQRALSLVPTDLKVIVFSNDIPWCKQNFIGDRFIFIEEIDYISIYLISKMKHHIIPNSTFSWWGAWLSEYPDKSIIAPKKWFGENDRYDGKDIVPDNWAKI
jgi:hypothetical protein